MSIIKPRVYVIIRGGLGNQLHQIAAGVRFAENRQGKLIIYSEIVDHAINPERRGFFRRLPLQTIFSSTLIREVNWIEKNLLRLFFKFSLKTKHVVHVNEENFENYFATEKIFLIRGWFQSHEFLPKTLSIKDLGKQPNNQTAGIVIHIRLTDFTDIDKDPLKEKYYRNALEIIGDKTLTNLIECYSDDLMTAKSMLSWLPNKYFPENRKKLDPVELLQCLSDTNLLISSRSSLCWWAGLVVIANGGTVISPFQSFIDNSKWITVSTN